jgi:arabinose-5-phosphate isomerase
MQRSIRETAREVFLIESAAVAQLAQRVDENIERAVALILECRGRVVVTGVGKSGHIGRKIASTLASTGTPALFLHAGEGLHGDLGMVAAGDVLIAISYTGRTGDLTGILPVVRDMQVPIIALTGNPNSYLAAQADVVLDIAVEKEACHLNLAPTASMAAALAMGDALAVCAMGERHFSSDDFARTHPGGTLGQTSKLRVGDLMRSGERLAVVSESATVRETLRAITDAQSGAALIVDAQSTLIGYLTDGDVRRRLLHCDNAETLLKAPVADFMTRTPLSFSPQMMAVEALRALQERGVDDAPVVDAEDRAVGILDVQELLRAGLV